MKNLIIQYYIDIKKYDDPEFNDIKPSPIEQYSSHSFQLYCEKYGCEYLKITNPKLNFMHPTWERFDLWIDRSWWDRYDNILYVDSDIIALNHAPDIFSMYQDTECFKAAWSPKFRDTDDPFFVLRHNPWREQYTKQEINSRFIQPGVFMLNKKCTEQMLPWIEKYRDVTDPKIDDGMYLNHCLVKSQVAMCNMDRKFNFKNNGQRIDKDTAYFLHCSGQKKHKKHSKIWARLRGKFPEIDVDISHLED